MSDVEKQALNEDELEFHDENAALKDISLEGDITVPGLKTDEDEFSTLDEPVKDTIMRDLKAVGVKFWHVLYPKKSSALLREWDLWGPLILCVFMAMILQGSEDVHSMGDGGPQFAEVFVIYWVGAVVVTLNTKLLGGDISFFQSVCVLGYCVCPLTIALIVCRVILVVDEQTTILFVIRFVTVVLGFGWSTFVILVVDEQTTILFVVRFVTVVLGFGWSTFASTAFLAESQPQSRKVLAMYPIFLFYFVISWLIISHTHS